MEQGVCARRRCAGCDASQEKAVYCYSYAGFVGATQVFVLQGISASVGQFSFICTTFTGIMRTPRELAFGFWTPVDCRVCDTASLNARSSTACAWQSSDAEHEHAREEQGKLRPDEARDGTDFKARANAARGWRLSDKGSGAALAARTAGSVVGLWFGATNYSWQRVCVFLSRQHAAYSGCGCSG